MNDPKVTNPYQPVAPFGGDANTPTAGSDIERLLALADNPNAGPSYAAIGAEMRARYESAKGAPPIAPKPPATTEGESLSKIMGGWNWDGK